MAYLLSSICTKNYWNPTTIVEIIIGGWVVSFFRDTVHFEHKSYSCIFDNLLFTETQSVAHK